MASSSESRAHDPIGHCGEEDCRIIREERDELVKERDDYAEELAEAKSALASAEARRLEADWRPIETAPKDGTRVMVYGCEYRRHWFGVGYYFKGVPGDGEGWIASSFLTMPNNDSSGSFTPSHWKPLPAPPLLAAKEAAERPKGQEGE